MELKCRLTHNLAEIKVDEIETTLFKSSPNEVEAVIENLLNIVDDLYNLIDKEKEDKVIDYQFTIDFVNWVERLTPSQKVSVWSKNGEHRGLFSMDNEQLLEKYKETL